MGQSASCCDVRKPIVGAANNLSAASNLYKALTQNDLEAAKQFYSVTAVIEIIGDERYPVAGVYKENAAATYFDKYTTTFDVKNFRLDELVVRDDGKIVGYVSAQIIPKSDSTKTFDTKLVQTLTYDAEGKIVYLREHAVLGVPQELAATFAAPEEKAPVVAEAPTAEVAPVVEEKKEEQVEIAAAAAPVQQEEAPQQTVEAAPAAADEKKEEQKAPADGHTHGMKVRIVVQDRLVVYHTDDKHSIAIMIVRLNKELGTEIVDITTSDRIAEGKAPWHHGDRLGVIYSNRTRLIAIVKDDESHLAPKADKELKVIDLTA